MRSIEARCHSSRRPRRSRPVAGEDDRPRVADVRERLGQLADQLRVERVPPLRLRERDAQHRSVALDAQARHGAEAYAARRASPRLRWLPWPHPSVRGAFAAALTPLRDDGARLDEDAFAPYAALLMAGGVGGILAGGTTGEGIALDPDERLRSSGAVLARRVDRDRALWRADDGDNRPARRRGGAITAAAPASPATAASPTVAAVVCAPQCAMTVRPARENSSTERSRSPGSSAMPSPVVPPARIPATPPSSRNAA